MKTTTLTGEDQVFAFPHMWPRTNDVIMNVINELSYEVKRVRPNGDVLVKHVGSDMTVRIRPQKIVQFYRAIRLHRTSIMVLTNKQ